MPELERPAWLGELEAPIDAVAYERVISGEYADRFELETAESRATEAPTARSIFDIIVWPTNSLIADRAGGQASHRVPRSAA